MQKHTERKNTLISNRPITLSGDIKDHFFNNTRIETKNIFNKLDLLPSVAEVTSFIKDNIENMDKIILNHGYDPTLKNMSINNIAEEVKSNVTIIDKPVNDNKIIRRNRNNS